MIVYVHRCSWSVLSYNQIIKHPNGNLFYGWFPVEWDFPWRHVWEPQGIPWVSARASPHRLVQVVVVVWNRHRRQRSKVQSSCVELKGLSVVCSSSGQLFDFQIWVLNLWCHIWRYVGCMNNDEHSFTSLFLGSRCTSHVSNLIIWVISKGESLDIDMRCREWRGHSLVVQGRAVMWSNLVHKIAPIGSMFEWFRSMAKQKKGSEIV